MLNREIFVNYFALLCEVYNKEASTMFIDAFYRGVSELPDDDWKRAVETLLKERTKESFPQIAEILEYAGGKVGHRAIIAKDKLMTATRNYGAYKTIAFDDPVIHKMVEMQGGWVKLNTMDVAELDKWFKWDFEKVYTAFYKMKFDKIPILLFGLHDSVNNVDDARNVVYIGDKTKALHWQGEYKKKLEALEDKKEVTWQKS